MSTRLKITLASTWPAYIVRRGFICRRRFTVEKRTALFWSKVRRLKNGCWIWCGVRNAQGYGRFGWPIRRVSSHRLSFFLTTGKDPFPLLVLHRCDRPACVNPDHLFLGTDKDNTEDARSKGRLRYVNGARTGHAKLTPNKVRAIRAALELRPHRYVALAGRYGVTPAAIRSIYTGKSWRHVK